MLPWSLMVTMHDEELCWETAWSRAGGRKSGDDVPSKQSEFHLGSNNHQETCTY